MGFLDNLKTLLDSHFKTDVLRGAFIGKKTEVHIHISGDVNVTPVTLRDNTLQIGLKQLSVAEADQILVAMREALQQEAYRFMETTAEKRLEEFVRVDESDETKRIIEALRPYIPQGDLNMIRAGLYIRQIYRNKGNTYELKGEALRKYGERGAKIANLCSANYFEEMILPLLEQMKAGPQFEPADFTRVYDTIIKESGFAIFVQANSSVEKVKELIKIKIEANIKYGLKHLHIHAIGVENIKRTREAIGGLLSAYRNLIKETDKVTGHTLYIKLVFEPAIADDLHRA